MYHTGIDVLSVLMARVAGTPLHAVLEERIARPLGLTSTSFQADGATLPTSYRPTADGGVEIFPEYDGGFAEPPLFETFGGGLVSTVEDYLTFLGALADGRVIPDELLKEMTGDQLSDEEKRGTTEMGGEALSWGLGIGVDVAVTKPWTAVGRYGWTGGAGTSGYTDPSRDLIGVVLSQRFMSGPRDDFSYFWGPVAEVAGK